MFKTATVLFKHLAIYLLCRDVQSMRAIIHHAHLLVLRAQNQLRADVSNKAQPHL